VNLAQIGSAVPDIFHTQRKKSQPAPKQNITQFTACGNNKMNKNSSGDEIANVNFYAVRHGSYPNSPKYRKITAITPFKVIQGQRF